MALYKYVKVATLKKILDGTIRFTQPSAFNDPFEMVPELYIPQSFVGTQANYSFSVTAPKLGFDEEFEIDSEYCTDEHSRQIRKQLDQKIGVLCLSKNPSSLVMWSHYADEYSGVVIEFDETHEFFTGAIEVKYQNCRQRIHINSYNKKIIPIADLCVKAKEWSYESEVRIVRSLSDCRRVSDDPPFPIFVMNLPRECIKEIILGERTDLQYQKAIYAMIYNTNIKLSLAAIANWNYEFRHSPIKYDQPLSQASPLMDSRTAHIFTDVPGNLGEVARWMVKKHKLRDMLNNKL